MSHKNRATLTTRAPTPQSILPARDEKMKSGDAKRKRQGRKGQVLS
jgi:hypothetical protein